MMQTRLQTISQEVRGIKGWVHRWKLWLLQRKMGVDGMGSERL